GQPTGPSWQGAVGSYFGGAPRPHALGAHPRRRLPGPPPWRGGRRGSSFRDRAGAGECRRPARRGWPRRGCRRACSGPSPPLSAARG
ncbi:porin, partial [Pseudomonas aeruginosa]